MCQTLNKQYKFNITLDKNDPYVGEEIKLALDVLDMMPEEAIFLIPLRLEECQVQDRLSSRQWVDLFVKDGYERLLKTLRLQHHGADKSGLISHNHLLE